MRNSRTNFNFIPRPEPEWGFTIIAPALPGCVMYGRNLAEAKKMANDAIAGYRASLKKHGNRLPGVRAYLAPSRLFPVFPARDSFLDFQSACDYGFFAADCFASNLAAW